MGLESFDTHNQTLCEKIKSIQSNIDCSTTVAITWATNFINSEPNILGFSSSESVFGFNLILPCVCNNPPNLNQQGYNRILVKFLESQRSAFKTFTQAQYSQKARRAINNETCDLYINGDNVFYGIGENREWLGPAVVIAQSNDLVLIRLQNTWAKVHPSRLKHYIG